MTWTEVYALWPSIAHEKIRSKARRYRKAHPDEFPQAETPHEEESIKIGVKTSQTNENITEIESTSTQIKTLDELIAACDIDLDVWRVDNWTIKSYDGWRGNAERDLTFDEGRISGYIRDGGIVTKTLWSVYAKLIRREPVPTRPTFAPIVIKNAPKTTRRIESRHASRSLLLSDAHIGYHRDTCTGWLQPFHDRSVLDVFCQIAQDYQPDTIGLLGDMLDMSAWSTRFTAKPEFYWTTQPALLELHYLLSRLRLACPGSCIVYLEGNHEVRLPNAVQTNMIEAYGLSDVNSEFPALSVPSLLGLHQLDVEWIDGYDNGTAIYRPEPWMRWEHGDVARTPGATSKAMIDNGVSWRFYGHIHRCEIVSKSFDDGVPPVSGVSFGCACKTDGSVPGSDPGRQWQKRFGTVEHNGTPESVTVEVIGVENGRGVWRGSEYVGIDYTERLVGDWNW